MSASPGSAAATAGPTSVVFVYAANDDHPGIARHVERKLGWLEDCGYQVTGVNAAGRGPRQLVAGRFVRELVAASRHAVIHLRLGRTTLVLAAWLTLLGRPVVAEINGFVHVHVNRRLQPAVRWALRRLGRAPSVTFVGDASWRPYVTRQAGSGARFVELPLTPGQWRIPSRPATSSIVFGGSLTESQGLLDLVAAWKALPPPLAGTWTLQLFGEGPLRARLEDVLGAPVGGPVAGPAYQEALASAGVLVAPYRDSLVSGDPLSSLKTLDYATTDRPMVTTVLDVVRHHFDDPEAALVFGWDGRSVEGLTHCLVRAIEAAGSPAAQDRWRTIEAARGPEVQRAALQTAIAASWSGRRTGRRGGRGVGRRS